MPCTYEPTEDEIRASFEERALFDSPASVLLCEATSLLEAHGLMHLCSGKLKKWVRKHEKQDEKKLRAELATKRTEGAKKKALAKLSKRERRILGLGK